MYARNQVIQAADYNLFSSKIQNILGTGTGSYGYGQTVPVQQVAIGNIISASNWNTLFSTMQTIALHQGTSLLGAAWPAIVSSNNTIAAYNYDVMQPPGTLLPLGDALSLLETNRGKLANPTYTTKLTSSRPTSAPWDQSVYSEFTVTFNDNNHARQFFNTGGAIRITPQLTSPSTTISTKMKELLENINSVVFFGISAPSVPTNSKPCTKTFYELNNTYQTVFILKIDNVQMSVQAKLNSPSVISFYVIFTEFDAQTIVQGNLQFTVIEHISSAIYPVISPTYALLYNLTNSAAIVPTMNISGPNQVQQGASITGSAIFTFGYQAIVSEEIVFDGVAYPLPVGSNTTRTNSKGSVNYVRPNDPVVVNRTWTFSSNSGTVGQTQDITWRVTTYDNNTYTYTKTILII